jgi:diguanylate cyclase (GGDEF)-like protein/PAS domain S-box-containing protein
MRTLPSGGHHCFIYSEAREARGVVGAFVDQGLHLKRRVLFLGSGETEEATSALAREFRRDRLEAAKRNQIVFRTFPEALHRKWGFDRFKALSFVADQITEAREDGFEGLHLIQEGGALQGTSGDRREPAAYEAGLTVFLRGQPCSVLCLYHRWNTTPEGLLRCLDLHPTELGEDLEEGPNPYYRPEVELHDVRWEHLIEERLRFLHWLRERPMEGEEHAAGPLVRRMLRRSGFRAASMGEVLERAVEELGRHMGARLGRAFLVDRSRDALLLDGAWELREGAPLASRLPSTERISLARGQGLAGRAWVARRPVWVPDLSEDPELDVESGPDRSPPRAGTGIPLLAGGGVIGALEFLFPEPREPDEALLEELQAVARSLGETLGRVRAEEELAGIREGLESLMEGSVDGIVITDRMGRIRSWNWAAARLMGAEAAEAPRGRPFEDGLPAESRGRFRKALELARASDEGDLGSGKVDLRFFRMGGDRSSVNLTLSPWDHSGEGAFTVLLRVPGGARQRDTQDRLIESVVSGSPREAMVVTSGQLRWGGPFIVFANPAFRRMTGYDESEVRGRSLRVLAGPNTDEEALGAVWRALARGRSVSSEFLAYRKDGEEFLMRLEMSPVRDRRGEVSHFIGVQTDLTEQRIVEEALQRADQDPLTGLANRVLFNKMLRRAIERSAKTPELRYAVLFMDLDGFKALNDTFGHVFGDRLLVSVADALEGAIRPGDVLARFGGDEFVILVEFVGGLDDVLTVAERVKDRLQRPFTVEGRDVRVGTSIGITLSETGYTSAEDVLRDADAAMYQVKEEGGGGYRIFDSALQEAAAAAGQLRGELEGSLDRGEFSLHYQPLLDLSTSRIAGLELLLRWRHPERGLVPASQFIPQAEGLELIVPLGRWVIREACRHGRAWQERFPSEFPRVLSVNLSPRELLDPRLEGWFRRSLEETGADPASLLVEVPESFFTRPWSQVRETLDPIRELGVQIGIDGFGGGHFSVAHLHRLPVDLLKIDPRFVAELPEREAEGNQIRNGRAIRSILALGKSLGMQVVAKGVETRGQQQVLEQLECQLAQGYLFSRPVDEKAAEVLLRAERIRRMGGRDAADP